MVQKAVMLFFLFCSFSDIGRRSEKKDLLLGEPRHSQVWRSATTILLEDSQQFLLQDTGALFFLTTLKKICGKNFLGAMSTGRGKCS